MKKYPDFVRLGENEPVAKEIEYAAPDHLKGNYEIWLYAKNSGGLSLALSRVGEFALNGNEKYAEIVGESCFLRVEGG